MKQAVGIVHFETRGRGLLDITSDIAAWLDAQAIEQGLVTLLCRHTSASLLIQENAAHEVRPDILDWLDRLAPEGAPYRHEDEGPDDMPAHLKALLTGVNLQVPVLAGRLMLGTWQGIYLAEHRRAPHRRQVAVHVIGE